MPLKRDARVMYGIPTQSPHAARDEGPLHNAPV